MALRELLTDVGTQYRNLKFGNDRPGGGSSKQPFIIKDLPPVESDPDSTFPDFLLRDPKNQLENRIDDTTRIGKFLLSRNGQLFIAKQELLSLQNPLVPGRPNRSNPVAGLYNPLMTLAQVAGSGTGLHIEKQGLGPIFNSEVKYASVYKRLDSDDAEPQTRLALLKQTKIGDPQNPDIQKRDTLLVTRNTGQNLGIAANDNFILSYNGGPNSPGLGRTRIPFANDRLTTGQLLSRTNDALQTSKNNTVNGTLFKTNNINSFLGASNKSGELNYINITTGPGEQNNTNFFAQNSVYTLGNTFPDENTANTINRGVYTFNQIQLRDRKSILDPDEFGKAVPSDFRKDIIGAPDKIGIYSFDYQNARVNRMQRIGDGNPGKRTRNRSRLNIYDNDTVDRINMIPLYRDRIVLDPDVLTRDLVKFRFEVIDNTNPDISTFVHFRAFLGAITDQYSSDWEGYRFVGRGDKVWNYQGSSRAINFSFKVAAQSRAEMRPLYQKLNYLASSLSPDYNGGYMKGNLIRLTIGDYLMYVPGFITSLTYTIPEEASWEIALNSPETGEDEGLMETPKYFEVDVAFTPIHDFTPRLNDGGRDVAFITNPTGVGGKENQYLDDNKIYFFSNGGDGIYGPGEEANLAANAGGVSTIEASNLLEYGTKGYDKYYANNFNIPVAPRPITQTQIPSISNPAPPGSLPLFTPVPLGTPRGGKLSQTTDTNFLD